MEYRVKLTDQFLDEFEEIGDYISNKLKNIDAPSGRYRVASVLQMGCKSFSNRHLF